MIWLQLSLGALFAGGFAVGIVVNLGVGWWRGCKKAGLLETIVSHVGQTLTQII